MTTTQPPAPTEATARDVIADWYRSLMAEVLGGSPGSVFGGDYRANLLLAALAEAGFLVFDPNDLEVLDDLIDRALPELADGEVASVDVGLLSDVIDIEDRIHAALAARQGEGQSGG